MVVYIGSSPETALAEYAAFHASLQAAEWQRWARWQQPEAVGLEDDHVEFVDPYDDEDYE